MGVFAIEGLAPGANRRPGAWLSRHFREPVRLGSEAIPARYDTYRLVPGGINAFTEPKGGAASQIWSNPLHGSREMGLLCWGGSSPDQRPPLDIAAQLSGK
jgi:hypothetical protein